jgi:mannan endo-1,6-alpha-mannosidase
MSALEYQFPDPSQAPANYLEVVTNAFENIVGRWDETSCGGGLKWQIYPENAYGYNYKNSISNGCTFALGARLARYTGEQKYADWAVKIYDWTKKVGLISDQYEVFDGSDDKKDCKTVADKTQWTYNNAMFLHGSAFMFDYTNGDKTWKERTSGFLDHAGTLFFGAFENSTDIMYEWACETGASGRHCNLDQQSFKAYLSRFIAKTALLAPFTKDKITKYLTASAVGAAKACSGGDDGMTCGSKWYTGSWDGSSGVGQQLSALEVTQALLMIKKGTLPAKKNAAEPSTTPTSSSAPKSTSASSYSAAPPASFTTKANEAVSSQVPSSGTVDQAPTPTSSEASEVLVQPSSTTSQAPESSTKTPEDHQQAPPPTVVIPSVVLVTSTATLAGETEATSTSSTCTKSESTSTSSSCTRSGTTTVTLQASSTSSTSCTTSVTTTVYEQPSGLLTDSEPAPTGLLTDSEPAPTGLLTDSEPAPTVPTTFQIVSPPVASSTVSPVAPPANSTVPTATGLPEFTGAAISVSTGSGSVMAALVVAAVFALL